MKRWNLASICALFTVTLGSGYLVADEEPDAPPLQAELQNIMVKQVAEGFSGIVLVAEGNGDIVFHQAYGLADRKTNKAITPETVISSGSLSKQITATAVALLAADGKLSLDDTLSKYFDSVPADKAGITIKQLLAHTGGLNNFAFPEDFVPITQKDWLKLVFETPLEHQPGEKFLYSNDGYTLASIIMVKVTGQGFQNYIRETFFEPLGMKHTGWFNDSVFDDPTVSVATGYINGKDDGAPNEWSGPYRALLGNGGIIWTPTDMLKWHKAIYSDFLSNDIRQRLFEPIAPIGIGDYYDGIKEPFHYGLGWFVGKTTCNGTWVGHSGAGISHNVDYRFYKNQDLLVYVASNKIDANYSGNETMYSIKAGNAIAIHLMKGC